MFGDVLASDAIKKSEDKIHNFDVVDLLRSLDIDISSEEPQEIIAKLDAALNSFKRTEENIDSSSSDLSE